MIFVLTSNDWSPPFNRKRHWKNSSLPEGQNQHIPWKVCVLQWQKKENFRVNGKMIDLGLWDCRVRLGRERSKVLPVTPSPSYLHRRLTTRHQWALAKDVVSFPPENGGSCLVFFETPDNMAYPVQRCQFLGESPLDSYEYARKLSM